MKNLFISVLVPTYDGAQYIKETIDSILHQNYDNFEIIINDDKSSDNTVDIIKKYKSEKIKVFVNKTNLGYPGNLEAARQKASGEIYFLMGQDDILCQGNLSKINNIFSKHPKIGAVTRPYFWFDDDINFPVRAKKQQDTKHDTIITMYSDKESVINAFDTLDQLSGLAYRKNFFDIPFHPDIFPCHIYPFASILKKHPIYFLSEYTIAVRIASSQTRKLSSIYNKSPILSWKQMIDTIFNDKKTKPVHDYIISDFVAKNYVGLVQIKNYSKFKNLIREIFYLIQFRPKNLVNLKFWFYSLGTIFTPPSLLIPLVDQYKKKIISKSLTSIKFRPQL